ncbi:hypothetical protein DMN91_005527 [Ooceraea biroi]|uniref:Uncharacterized protein n=1 Tax=Ooceraea biroi TaxID=2015173 RepID=A0A3L8DL35_OOCBI|nr:hypothetical protein DMN91_005527 [Ooceraea biroi]
MSFLQGWDHSQVTELPSVRSPVRSSYVGDEAREGGCAERNLCRAGSAAGIARSYQCPPSFAAWRPPSIRRPAHASVSNRASRFRRGRHACRRNPRAPYTAVQAAVDSTKELEPPLSTLYFPHLRESQWIVALSILSLPLLLYNLP